MKTILLMVFVGSFYNLTQCLDSQETNLSGRNLTNIPTNCSTDTTKLNLSQNYISLNKEDQTSLGRYENLTELNLCQNNITELKNSYFTGLSKLEVLILRNNQITSVGEMSLFGLGNLRILDLSLNRITYLPANIQIPSMQLQAFYLQENNLTTLDIKDALKDLKTSLNITLNGNPWNCSCSLISLSSWLNNNIVILENENITLCAAPKSMVNYNIKEINTAPAELLGCIGSSDVSSTTTSTLFIEGSTVLVNVSINGTNATSTRGNSWTFLVGVIVVGLVTSLLILAAVKFPRWYDYILSYNHHRLKEEEPYMFEEEFNVDFDMCTNDKNQEDDTVVVFEQTHSFVPEEDGFIEDKYIDEHDITELN
ncbi:leucine-rich repeat-containing protein 19 [Hyla sarda]|uniref:leucine-rich repeat-containing protein 19 n=1 Tax=Hyla sarda TaxID=327740 RepID=UPI0024C2F5CD|nr:leucine-rich repeat-containing protein 19 [Hyla sarda]XP_056376775.1 leucine-rich repeat-containing protein 19 [Hyla sarda]XP_056376779.1 leucine-rich repeat-containing protein 19 [Hyla sarda]